MVRDDLCVGTSLYSRHHYVEDLYPLFVCPYLPWSAISKISLWNGSSDRLLVGCVSIYGYFLVHSDSFFLDADANYRPLYQYSGVFHRTSCSEHYYRHTHNGITITADMETQASTEAENCSKRDFSPWMLVSSNYLFVFSSIILT